MPKLSLSAVEFRWQIWRDTPMGLAFASVIGLIRKGISPGK